MISQNKIDKLKDSLDYLLTKNLYIYLSDVDYGKTDDEISFLITPKFIYQKKPP